MNPTSIEALQKLASFAPNVPRPTINTSNGSVNTNDKSPYGAAALSDELATLGAAIEGNRNNQLNNAAFNLGQLVGGGVLSEWEVTRELERVGLSLGLDHTEVRGTIQSGLRAGMREPRYQPVSTFSSIGHRQESQEPHPDQVHHPAPPNALQGLVRLSDVEPEQVLWLWPGRIPLGKLTILDGDPGLGKSMITCDLAARVSTGREMPDGEKGDLDGPAGVVLLSAEDGLADTIRPRLHAAGADCTRIAALTHVVDETGLMKAPNVANLDEIEKAIATTEAKLVIIDPVVAYLPGNAKSHNDQDVRRVLAPLAELAERKGVAILMLRHLNKAPGGNPLYRGGGSIAFIGAVRSGLLAAQDPEDETGQRRVIASTKSNLALTSQALAYHVVTADNGAARIEWDGLSEHTAAGLLTVLDQEDKSAVADAVAFLEDLLQDDGCKADDVWSKARQQGISKRTLDRAKSRLSVKSVRCGAVTDAYWMWVLSTEGA
jgi:RecA-family ATPase